MPLRQNSLTPPPKLAATVSHDVFAVSKLADESGLSSWTPKALLNELDHDDSVFITLKLDNALAGFVLGRIVPSSINDESRDAEIYAIAVAKTLRRSRYGEALISRFAHICRERSVRTVWLEVRESNRGAIAFYEMMGFIQRTKRRSFYTNPTEDAIIMSVALETRN